MTVGTALLCAALELALDKPPLTLRTPLRLIYALVILVAAMRADRFTERGPPVLGVGHKCASVDILTVVLLGMFGVATNVIGLLL
jgi:hypothetical protein